MAALSLAGSAFWFFLFNLRMRGYSVMEGITRGAGLGFLSVLSFCVGIGTLRYRRWVRPVVLAAAPAVLIRSLWLVESLPRRILLHHIWQPTFQFSVAFGIPIAAFSYYRRANVHSFLQSRDPLPGWTDSVELPLFAWCGGCLIFGLQNLLDSTSATLASSSGWAFWLPFILLDMSLIGAAVLALRKIRAGWLATVLVALLFLADVAISPLTKRDQGEVVFRVRRNEWADISLVILQSLAFSAAVVYGTRMRRYLRPAGPIASSPILDAGAK